MNDRQGSLLSTIRDLIGRAEAVLKLGEVSKLEPLFHDLENASIKGRFLRPTAVSDWLRKSQRRYDQVNIGFVRVEELRIETETAYVSLLCDVSWIDLDAWSEVAASMIVTLTMHEQGGAWAFRGLTAVEVPMNATSGAPHSGSWFEEAMSLGPAQMEFYSFSRYAI